jgi:hypothetical protein
MSYLHINNLYKDQAILAFREAYALEKLHGTSAHVKYSPIGDTIKYFSGGESFDRFVKLFNDEDLKARFKNLGLPMDQDCTVYGEAYGGSQQGMSATYGKTLKFCGFDVKIGTAGWTLKRLTSWFVPWAWSLSGTRRYSS